MGITRVVAVLPVAREAAREARDRSLVVDEGESERARIAADIHDDVIQDLSMLVHRLDRAGEDDAAATLRGAIDRLRAICADLRLPVIHDLGLAAALEALVGEVRAASGIDIDLRYDGDGRLPYDVELGLYRIAQEAVANAVKHGRPPITVRLRAESGRAELEVEDRGPGVGEDALARPASPGHLGFLTMAQRAAKLGAELAVADRPEGGTRVRVVWSGDAASPAADGRSGRGDVTAEPRPIRVAIVDDHPVVRDGMAALLREYPGIEIAGTAASLDLAEPLLDPALVDVLLLDIRLGGGDRLSAPRAPSGCRAAAGGRGAHRVRAGRVRGGGAPPRRRRARAQDRADAGARGGHPGGGARRARRCGARPSGDRPDAHDPRAGDRPARGRRPLERRDRRGAGDRDQDRRGPPAARVRSPRHRVAGGAVGESGRGGVARRPDRRPPSRARADTGAWRRLAASRRPTPLAGGSER